MNICLVAATDLEIPFFADKVKSPLKKLKSGIYSIQWNENLQLTILISGVGTTQTTFHLASLLQTQQFDFIIQAGICGAFNRNISLGDVVNIQSEKFAQAGAQDDDIFLDVFELGLEDENAFPFTKGRLINNTAEIVSLNQLPKVKGITVETVHGNENSIEKIMQKYNPDVESMEGAAFFYCCLHHNIPFVEIRAVSNYVEKRNKANWNIPLAVQSLQQVVVTLLNDLSK